MASGPTLLKTKKSFGSVIIGPTDRHFILDVTTSDEHRYPFGITQHPVEDEVEFSDHIQQRPVEVVINGIISNTPVFQSNPEPNRSGTAYDLLTEVANLRLPVTVITGDRLFGQMGIKEFKVLRGTRISANELRVRISLMQVRSTTTQFVLLDESLFADDVADSGSDEDENGSNPGEELAPDEPFTSWLSDGIDGLSRVIAGPPAEASGLDPT